MNQPQFQPKTADVFNLFGDSYNARKLYFSIHRRLPCQITIRDIDIYKLKKWVNSGDYMFDQVITHANVSVKKTGDINVSEAFYILDNGILIEETLKELNIFYDPSQDKDAKELVRQISKHCSTAGERTARICLIVQDRSELETKAIRLPRPRLSIERQYNDDFPPIHKRIAGFLKKTATSGLILLHGQPGTGKSTYIRFLLQRIRKKVLFLSPALASNLDNPSLMTLLLANRECIVVIEDAEDLLASRESNKNDAISTILNLTDGILGSSLGIQFIATFNTHIRNIDKALLRKGRLAAMYEFKALSAEKATTLMKSIDPTCKNAHAPMTLAEIYHAGEDNNGQHQSKTPIGFSVRQTVDV